MISSHFKEHIAQELGTPIVKIKAVSGGDISKAYCVFTSTQRFFLKVNKSANALKMFLTEKDGLDLVESREDGKKLGVPEDILNSLFPPSTKVSR